ncbi:hypothetical protein [Roseateles aquatilis]|uniref:hypothetical protein n=1 Tax=Roseateles aquatilis TaxID=431061 RepID=UPI0011316A3F|nr:hypothetical protein [Roseateles aquatilis]
MSDASPVLVIVDTNCYVRLYYSEARPLLGTVVAGHRLVTLAELAGEAARGTPLVDNNGWLLQDDIQRDLREGILALTASEANAYWELADQYRQMGDAVLFEHCQSRGILVRSLSRLDALALAVATDRTAVLATDEWPLRLVAGQCELDDGSRARLFSSLDLLRLLEIAGAITPVQRRDIVRRWIREGEHLMRDWAQSYRALFNESPPTVQ